jgi:protein TonB
MLAYAASRPTIGKARSSPNAMLVVISAHVAVIAAVMSAKMDLPQRILRSRPIIVDLIKEPPPPPPLRTAQPGSHTDPTISAIDRTRPEIPLPPTTNPADDPGPTVDPGAVSGGGAAVVPEIPRTVVTPVHHGPELLTPASQLKPPYPASKLLSEEEATLTLRLSIDETGRVIAVSPIGRADSAFLDAARRHLMAHWRYRAATDDGRAVPSSVTVTLRFMLDG